MNLEKTLTVFLSKLPPTLTRDHLVNHFSAYGEIQRIQIPLTNTTGGVNKGYAFLQCKDRAMFDSVLQASHSICSTHIAAREYLDKEEVETIFNLTDNRPRTIYLENIPSDVSNRRLHGFFERFGEIEAASAVRGLKKHKDIFYGYVLFKKGSAISKLPKRKVKIGDHTILWKRFRLGSGQPPTVGSNRVQTPNQHSQKEISIQNDAIRNQKQPIPNLRASASPLKIMLESMRNLEIPISFNHSSWNIRLNRNINFCPKKLRVCYSDAYLNFEDRNGPRMEERSRQATLQCRRILPPFSRTGVHMDGLINTRAW